MLGQSWQHWKTFLFAKKRLRKLENDLCDDLCFTLFSLYFFQDVKLNGNKLNRVPTEALRGPESLQNLDLPDNFIGK